MTVAGSSGRLRVLVVEDEVLVCQMLADALADEGFTVHAVSSADDALRHLARGEPCDVLFTDINLGGDGVDGAELARAARLLRPGLPVVYASGAYRGLHELHAVPGASFVPKPYDTGMIAAVLCRAASMVGFTPGPSASPSG